MSAAPAKKRPATKAAKGAAKKTVAKPTPKTTKKAAGRGAATKAAPTATSARPSAAPAAPAPAAATGPVEVCPRCGTTKFGPEERTRWESRRTVRYTVLVCERGHTFAHPITRAG